MKNELSNEDNRRWSSLKTKWCADMLTSNNSDLAKSRRQKMPLKLPVTKFSNVSRLRRTSAEPKRSSRRTYAMSFISKKVSKLRLLVSVLSWKKESELNWSYKRPKTSN